MATWESLSGSQREAVAHTDGPCAVYAGPGSGKTRVVTLRAARLAASGRRLLVTTFTADATEEMRSRLAGILEKSQAANVTVSTMHALCLQTLKAHGSPFHLLTDPHLQRNLAESAKAAEIEGGVRAFLSQISYQKNLGVTPQTYKADSSQEDRDFLRCWKDYEKIKAGKNLREFDDLILDTAALLENEEAVRQEAARKFTHIIVDECQDMNLPQYTVAFALGRDHRNVMLVGDLDQSLYAFRGADTRTFQLFAKNAQTKVYELRENYRSTRSILQFADSLIRQDEERRPIDFVPTRDEGDPVSWNRFPDPDLEALAVGEEILHLVKRGAMYREIAVLYRTNAQSEAFERHFAALEIPYTMRDDGDFYARKEVQGILSYLQFFARAEGKSPEAALADPEAFPDEWLLALLNVPNRKLSRVVGAQLRHEAEFRRRRIWEILPQFNADDLKTHRALRALREELSRIAGKTAHLEHAGKAVEAIREATHFDHWLKTDEGDERDNDRLQNIARMQAAAAHYPTVKAYLDAVQKVRDESSRRKAEKAKRRREADEVMLSTGHSAKGLEWRYVFAVGWSEEILPHRKAISEPNGISEERRIAYVIATRARDALHISTLDTWNDAGVAPSRFIAGLNLRAGAERPTEAGRIEAETALPTLGGLFMEV